MPRETFTAPLIVPVFSTSEGSRTSRMSVFSALILSEASEGKSLGTQAFASASICWTVVGIISSQNGAERRLSVDGELVRLFHGRLEWWRQKPDIGYDRQLHVLAAKVQYRRRKIEEQRPP